MRIRCWLLGCVTDSDPCCHRCGEDLYAFEFVQIGRLDPLFRRWRRVVRLTQKVTGKRCQVCHKRYWGGDDYVCGDECLSDWLPF